MSLPWNLEITPSLRTRSRDLFSVVWPRFVILIKSSIKHRDKSSPFFPSILLENPSVLSIWMGRHNLVALGSQIRCVRFPPESCDCRVAGNLGFKPSPGPSSGKFGVVFRVDLSGFCQVERQSDYFEVE